MTVIDTLRVRPRSIRAPIAGLLLSTSLVGATLCGSAEAEDEDAWLPEPGEEPAPRYGPGGTRAPKRSPNTEGSAMLGIGIGLTAVGGMGVLGGAYMGFTCLAEAMAEGECSRGGAVAALAGGGAAAVAIGIPLIVSGIRKRHHGSGSLRLHVGALPQGAGLGLSGSF